MNDIRNMEPVSKCNENAGYVRGISSKVHGLIFNKEEGLDGILVTIGLCIIALLLCVVMRDSLTEFIQTIVTEMTNSAKNILQTAGVMLCPGSGCL